MRPDRVRRVVATHEVAVEEDRSALLPERRDLSGCEARRRRQHELHRVLHRLGGVVDERVHGAGPDVDGQDPLVLHEPMLA